MFDVGLLVISQDILLEKVIDSLHNAGEYVNKTLYVTIQGDKDSSVANKLPKFGSLLRRIYEDSDIALQLTDVRVLISNLRTGKLVKILQKVDVILFDVSEFSRKELQRMGDFYETKNIIQLSEAGAKITSSTQSLSAEEPIMYNTVVLGGTFDRLHSGHKILLSEAVIRCKKRLVVGVTDENMIKSKKLFELIEPVRDRIENVKSFLEDIDNTLLHEVVPIKDPFGPTATDPDMDMIVVSEETLRGGEKVNELRKSKGLKTLEIHTIKLVDCCETKLHYAKEKKVSSSNTRIDLLGKRIRKYQCQKHNLPYIVGLTGGPRAGKTTMAKRFGKLGATIIDCNDISAEKPADVVSLIVKKRIDETATKSGVNVIILDSNSLIELHLNELCDEVWSCIIPEVEAIRRIAEKYETNDEEARQFLDKCIKNETLVKHSTVVFSPQWDAEVMDRQVQNAWRELQNVISQIK